MSAHFRRGERVGVQLGPYIANAVVVRDTGGQLVTVRLEYPYRGRRTITVPRDQVQRFSSLNPARKKKRRPTGGNWNLDLWGGQGIEREGATRAEQLEIARDEMRRSGSGDLFDWLADQDKQRNPSDLRRLDELGRQIDYASRQSRSAADPAVRRRARQRLDRLVRAYRAEQQRNPDTRTLKERRLELAFMQGRRAHNTGIPIDAHGFVGELREAFERGWRHAAERSRRNPQQRDDDEPRYFAYRSRRTSGTHHPECPRGKDVLATCRCKALRKRDRERRERNPADTPEKRYQRAVGHGERLTTARKAAANPGRAVGRMAPNCPMCGALVRLPNPIPRTVRCAGCGAESLVRRP